jgi:hypothetical protein
LMIVDIPEGLPVPIVSSPPTSVPVWNSADVNFLPLVFDFGSSLVHDNGAFLLFHKDDLKLRADIRGYAKAYHFSIFKEWTGINRLPITSPRDASKTVSGSSLLICFILVFTSIYDFHVVHHLSCYIVLQTLKFCIQLLVRSYPKVPSSTFSIRPMAELDSVGIDVAVDDVVFNLVTKDTQLMRGSTPWRGGREKDPVLLQLLIESTTQVGDIVLDCTSSTGTKFLVILSFVAFSVLIMTLLLTIFFI